MSDGSAYHCFGWPLCDLLRASAGASAGRPRDRHVVSTSDVKLDRSNGSGPQPQLAVDEWPGRHFAAQSREEPLPAKVEINGADVPVAWKHKPEPRRRTQMPHHAVLVYESDNPHLRLRWEWQARADFGPIEHRIHLENLGDKEVWLPMIDSLRWTGKCAANDELRNFYVEKGAGTPSAQGTHIDTVADGYRWTGTSSTYAHPPEGAPREIIPAEFVYSAANAQAGWFAGIEFSGRTRVTLERTRRWTLQSALGLNPDPGPFRTRLAPGGHSRRRPSFSAHSMAARMGQATSFAPGCAPCWAIRITWKDQHYPWVVNNSWGSGMAVDEPLALRMIGESKELGVEMFHIDAGWFRGVGDWYPDPEEVSPRPCTTSPTRRTRRGCASAFGSTGRRPRSTHNRGRSMCTIPRCATGWSPMCRPTGSRKSSKAKRSISGYPAAHDYLPKGSQAHC